jgi:hypothetical protein
VRRSASDRRLGGFARFWLISLFSNTKLQISAALARRSWGRGGCCEGTAVLVPREVTLFLDKEYCAVRHGASYALRIVFGDEFGICDTATRKIAVAGIEQCTASKLDGACLSSKF